MPEGEPDIAYCHACGGPMDVSAVGPFTNVECPTCKKHTRVKREFGPYTLMRRHAIGGMSVVFVAQDNTLNREVILKILNEEYSADDKRIGAFEEEARITAAISHPHVVRVFTTGRAFERFYIAMEFVPGGHYEHHIRERGSIPESEVLPLAIEVAEGLQAAHQAGLIHRDVKPGNILLDGNGNAKIVDFGLALVTKGGKAKASEIWATPYYVPPETIDGLEEDFRSDVYAFGASFYHALAGRPPCDEESMDTRRLRAAKQNLTPLNKVAPWISKETANLMDRCMAFDPGDRFRSYGDLIAALKSAQQNLAAGPPSPEPTASQGKGSSRRSPNRLAERLALGVSCLLVVAAIGFAFWWVGRDDEPDQALDPSLGAAETPLIPLQIEGNGDGAALQVAKNRREAVEALGRRAFGEAKVKFVDVRDDPKAMEPTASLAACEAVMSCFLAGRSDEARSEAQKALEHVKKAQSLNPQTRSAIQAAIEPMSRLKVAPLPADHKDKGVGVLALMMMALKTWEQGLPDIAEEYFSAVASAPRSGENVWLAPYSLLSEDYLSDLKILREAEPKSFALSEADAEALINELEALRRSLKTKGRAGFNVRCWQLELKRQSKLPLIEEEEEAPTLAEQTLEEEALACFKKCQFVEGVELLKAWQPLAADDLTRREGQVALGEAAMSFFAALEERVDGPIDIEMSSRQGENFVELIRAEPRGLTLKNALGKESLLPWSEVEPLSLITLHRLLTRAESSEFDRMRQHEQAVAFDLLAGDPVRALEAGDRLAQRSAPFNRRWRLLASCFRQ